jgi:hypothetical protein
MREWLCEFWDALKEILSPEDAAAFVVFLLIVTFVVFGFIGAIKFIWWLL